MYFTFSLPPFKFPLSYFPFSNLALAIGVSAGVQISNARSSLTPIFPRSIHSSTDGRKAMNNDSNPGTCSWSSHLDPQPSLRTLSIHSEWVVRWMSCRCLASELLRVQVRSRGVVRALVICHWARSKLCFVLNPSGSSLPCGKGREPIGQLSRLVRIATAIRTRTLPTLLFDSRCFS